MNTEPLKIAGIEFKLRLADQGIIDGGIGRADDRSARPADGHARARQRDRFVAVAAVVVRARPREHAAVRDLRQGDARRADGSTAVVQRERPSAARDDGRALTADAPCRCGCSCSPSPADARAAVDGFSLRAGNGDGAARRARAVAARARGHRRDGARGAKRGALHAARLRPAARRRDDLRDGARARAASSTASATIIGTSRRDAGARRSAPSIASGPAPTAGSSIFHQRRGSRPRLSAASRAAAVRRSRRASRPSRAPRVGGCSHTAAPGAFRAQETRPRSVRAERDLRRPRHRRMAGDAERLCARGARAAELDRRRARRRQSSTSIAAAPTMPSSCMRPGTRATGAAGPVHSAACPSSQSMLGQFGRAGGRFSVLDKDGWVLAVTGSVAPGATADDGARPRRRLVSLAARARGSAVSGRAAARAASPTRRCAKRCTGAKRRRGTAAARSRGDRRGGRADRGRAGVEGAVVLEQASEPILTLTNRALVRLMTLTLLATLVVGAGLLGYATWLSLRVRRLAGAAQTALGPRGEIRSANAGRGAGDEIGALARSFDGVARAPARAHGISAHAREQALARAAHAARRRHDVARQSRARGQSAGAPRSICGACGRARSGSTAILAAMSEATELEQAIRETAAQPFDLAAVVASCCAAYRDVYRRARDRVSLRRTGATIVGSGELVAQLLDKLVDNAVSFAARGQPHRRRARRSRERARALRREPRADAAGEDARAVVRLARVDPRAARRAAALGPRAAHRRARRGISRRPLRGRRSARRQRRRLPGLASARDAAPKPSCRRGSASAPAAG